MVVYGAGGHAKAVVDILQSTNTKIFGVLDDNPEVTHFLNLPFLGRYASHIKPGHPFIITIGDNKIRKKIVETIDEDFKSAIHRSAVLSEYAKIGAGTCIMANVVVNADTNIGAHCIINTSAVIEHDCHLSNFVHIAPNATITGEVSIGEGTLVGAGAIVVPGTKIGKWAIIGAGTTVIENVPDYSVVVGSPGKVIKFNK